MQQELFNMSNRMSHLEAKVMAHQDELVSMVDITRSVLKRDIEERLKSIEERLAILERKLAEQQANELAEQQANVLRMLDEKFLNFQGLQTQVNKMYETLYVRMDAGTSHGNQESILQDHILTDEPVLPSQSSTIVQFSGTTASRESNINTQDAQDAQDTKRFRLTNATKHKSTISP